MGSFCTAGTVAGIGPVLRAAVMRKRTRCTSRSRSRSMSRSRSPYKAGAEARSEHENSTHSGDEGHNDQSGQGFTTQAVKQPCCMVWLAVSTVSVRHIYVAKSASYRYFDTAGACVYQN